MVHNSHFRYFLSSQHIALCKNTSFWKERPEHCMTKGLVSCHGNYPGFCTKKTQKCKAYMPSVKEILTSPVCPDKSDHIICYNGGQCEGGFFRCRDNRTCIPSKYTLTSMMFTRPGQKMACSWIDEVRFCICIQGTSKERFPGCEVLDEKVAFCLPTAGRNMQFFHPLFTQPGKHSLEVPCTYSAWPCLGAV